MNCNGDAAANRRATNRLGLGLTLVGALVRLVPHPPNFTSVGALGLYSGAWLAGWRAYLVPLLVMAVTDPIFGFSGTTPFVYASFLLNVWIGRRLQLSIHPRRLAGAILISSVQFFLITNLGVWLVGGLYPHTITGITTCYFAALPFFGRTLAGDLLYSGLLFGLHFWASRLIAESNRLISRNTSPA